MTLQEAFDFLNFWINKSTGAWYTIEELENICDRGQLSLYEDLQLEYATSQRVKDALAPFRQKYEFAPVDTTNGVVTVPSNLNYLNLIDVQIRFAVGAINNYVSIKMYNEDEMSHRLMSQIDPVTTEFPIGEVLSPGVFQLYPKTGYTGTVTYFRRPRKPHAVYTVVGGRTIVIDNNDPATIPLEFPENWQNAVLAKALSSVGINIGEADIMQYAELKTSNNFQSQNML
jgi:hypothetical protein